MCTTALQHGRRSNHNNEHLRTSHAPRRTDVSRFLQLPNVTQTRTLTPVERAVTSTHGAATLQQNGVKNWCRQNWYYEIASKHRMQGVVAQWSKGRSRSREGKWSLYFSMATMAARSGPYLIFVLDGVVFPLILQHTARSSGGNRGPRTPTSLQIMEGSITRYITQRKRNRMIIPGISRM
jgi:hypothetical protein